MKKTKLPVILALALVLVFLLSFAGTAENVQPGISIGEVSLRISEQDKLGLRFVSSVQLPLPDGARITEQGTLIVPLYVNGYEDFTLETEGPTTVLKTENKIYSAKNNSYQFAAVLEEIPVYHLKSPICARSFITYTVGEESNTVYSEIEIFDAYSLAQAQGGDFQTQVVAAYDSYVNSAKAAATSGTLTVTAPAENEVVYPYTDDAKSYLESTDDVSKTGDPSKLTNYSSYHGTTKEVAKGIDITWTDSVGAESYTVMYATQADYSDAKFAWSTAEDTEGEFKVSLYNLYKGTTYYVKIIANGDQPRTVTTTFKTTDLGPRVIYLNGPHNARDLGGYVTPNGTTLQGLLYRSGKFNTDENDNVDATVSDFGRYLVRADLELKTELDLRVGYTQTFEGVQRIEVYTVGYELSNAAWDTTLPAIFEVLADINNYPIVFHCQGGADRTGTVAYLINGLLGVTDLDLAHDYEFTSYSWYGLRHMNFDAFIAKNNNEFFNTLDSYVLDSENADEVTTQVKVERYLLDKGVTPEQIANVKSIMLTGQPVSVQE